MSFATLTSGGRLAYDEFTFAPPWTSPEPVVLVHGFTKNRRFWYGWLPQLAERYRVINVDVRGHNDSSPLPGDFTMALQPFSDDFAEFLDALGLDSAHFVMAEFSSAVAVDFAIRHPARIRSLTLAGFTFNLKGSAVPWDEWIDIVETKGSAEWARITNHTRLPAAIDPAMRAWYVGQQGRIPDPMLAKVFRFIKDLDLSDRLGEVAVPTMILAGDQAVQAPIADVRRAAAAMPDCRLEIIAGMPFNVMNAAPDQCVRRTMQFLQDFGRREQS